MASRPADERGQVRPRPGWRRPLHPVVKWEIDPSDGRVWATCGCGSEWVLDPSERNARLQSSEDPSAVSSGCRVDPERTEVVYYDYLVKRARVLCLACIAAWYENGLNVDLRDMGPAPVGAPCENCLAENRLGDGS